MSTRLSTPVQAGPLAPLRGCIMLICAVKLLLKHTAQRGTATATPCHAMAAMPRPGSARPSPGLAALGPSGVVTLRRRGVIVVTRGGQSGSTTPFASDALVVTPLQYLFQ